MHDSTTIWVVKSIKIKFTKKKIRRSVLFFFYSLFNFNKKIRLATLINNGFQGRSGKFFFSTKGKGSREKKGKKNVRETDIKIVELVIIFRR